MEERLLELIAKTSAELPQDVALALRQAEEREAPGSSARSVLATLNENVKLACQRQQPLCQDTGALHFFVQTQPHFLQLPFERAAGRAVARATELGLLRQNCVETLSGRNTGNNLGYVNPTFHWQIDESGPTVVTLMLKGGGSENMGCQYSLPDDGLRAGRDLEGVRRCVLDAVWRAQGQGCAPGILGVAIGGDRAGGHEESKLQLLRQIGQRSPQPELAALEERLLTEINTLGIGPMGFGGVTTALEVFIGSRCRIPASYFVSVTYMCWCCRRLSMILE